MALDFHTLFVTIILISVALSTIWGTISWMYRSFRPAPIWCFASILLAMGGLFLPFLPSGNAILAASCNGLATLGVWLFWLGLRRFHGMEGGWRLIGLATLAILLLTVAFHRNGAALVSINEVGKSIPMLLSMVHLLDRSRRTAGAVLSCAGISIGLMGHSVDVAMIVASAFGAPQLVNTDVVGSLSMMSVIFSGVLWNFGLAVMTIESLRNEVAALANTDPLTAVSNRRKFDEILGEENERSARSGRPYALILLDLDHFKAINDRLGHKGGGRQSDPSGQGRARMSSAERRSRETGR
ncbi:diguanylate cyclase [Brucella oryzae]|uniref:GGDEF domain-containing protein n=1 Tax=Brucella oryzae TaxID=335286 RepID=UPI001B8333E9|nr:sensor domain-containing diguanylate cyclase [Brucella oryzae]MBR7653642.1 diguanylate cyclase [Brucella oryzae]